MSASDTTADEVIGQYLGMALKIESLDAPNREFFAYCAAGELRLQRCQACQRLRCPPGTACPWCANDAFGWVAVAGTGQVYSYTEVAHAIQPAFKAHTPYLVLLVELDEQRGNPSEDEGLRMIGNLADEHGSLASPEMVQTVGIGSRVKVVFKPVADGLAIPLWVVDDSAQESGVLWRYPT